LTGRYRGFDIRMEPVVDHMAARKLPSLWLKVSIVQPTSHRGVFDLLMRPQGVEFYSPSSALQYRVRVPSDWPKDAIVCTDDPESMPPLDAVQPHIHLFADPRMKELVVAPGGVRLVYQVDQGERSHYNVLRQAKFAQTRLSLPLAERLLESAIAIHSSLAA
jgi:hypothetical protein